MECVFCSQNCDFDLATEIQHLGTNSQERKPHSEEISVKNKLIKTFLKFLERHLTSTNYVEENELEKSVKTVTELWENILSSSFEGEVTGCDNCLKIVKSFCDLYHDLKTIQLLLDLQLSNLNDALKKTQQHPPTSSFQHKIPSVCKGDNNCDKLSEFRTWLSDKCSRKLRNAYPKLVLEKETVPSESPTELEITVNPSLPYESPTTFIEDDNLSVDIEPKCLSNATGHSKNEGNSLTGTEEERKDNSDIVTSLYEQKNVKLEQIDGERNICRNLAIKEEETVKVKETAEEPDPDPFVPRTLRRIHKCFNCNKTFSNSEGLLSHLQECPFQDYEMGEDGGNDPVDAESDFECGDEMSKSSDSSARESSPPLGTPPTTQMPLKKTLKEKKATKREMSKGKIKVEKEEEKGKRLKCSFCSVSVSHHNSLRLRQHIRLVHPEKWRKGQGLLDEEVYKYTHRFKCPTCEKLFKKLHLFQLHWRETHSKNVENRATNKLCIEIVAIPTNLECITQSENIRSILVREKSKKYARIQVPLLGPEQELRICKVKSCQRPFYSKEDLEIHSKLHGKFKCEKCPVEKGFLPELSAHEINTHGKDQNTIKCQRCPATFTEFLPYVRHHSSVHFSLDFNEQSCLICKSYLHKYECKGQLVKLFLHLKRGHDLDSELEESRGGGYRCTESDCSAYFMSLTGLNHHRRTQHHLKKEEIKEFKKARDVRVCEECGKKFKDQHLLDQHRIHHQGPESWSFCCEICSKKCSTRQKLDEHLRTHTKEKPFVCEVCGVKYAHRHNLRIHVKNKHGEEETVGINATSKENAKKRKSCEKSRKGSNRKKRTKRAISKEDTTESEDGTIVARGRITINDL